MNLLQAMMFIVVVCLIIYFPVPFVALVSPFAEMIPQRQGQMVQIDTRTTHYYNRNICILQNSQPFFQQQSSFLLDGATAWLTSAQQLDLRPVSYSTTSATAATSLFLSKSSSSNNENVPPPSVKDIQLLRQAFSEYYARNYEKAIPLLDTVIDKWSGQPHGERAALYRTRADCYMNGLVFSSNNDAAKLAWTDYDTCLKLLHDDNTNHNNNNMDDEVDPSERMTAWLGRARAGRAGGSTNRVQIADDYKQAMLLLGDDEYDDEQTELDALTQASNKNPYAMWEYAAALRQANCPNGDIRLLAATSFATIGDTARSVITQIDAGIDYAAAGDIEVAKSTLSKAISKTVGVEGRDVRLLQRVISKEGEGRLALAALYWSDDDKTMNPKAQAEAVLGDACLRLDQLSNQMDGTTTTTTITTSASTTTGSAVQTAPQNKLRFSIDDNDDVLVGTLTCTRFKNKDFLTNALGWPESLQDKVLKLQVLSR